MTNQMHSIDSQKLNKILQYLPVHSLPSWPWWFASQGGDWGHFGTLSSRAEKKNRALFIKHHTNHPSPCSLWYI